jgi:hypothetical protein
MAFFPHFKFLVIRFRNNEIFPVLPYTNSGRHLQTKWMATAVLCPLLLQCPLDGTLGHWPQNRGYGLWESTHPLYATVTQTRGRGSEPRALRCAITRFSQLRPMISDSCRHLSHASSVSLKVILIIPFFHMRKIRLLEAKYNF